LGKTISTAIDLANNIVQRNFGYAMYPTTSSVPLIDDYQPLKPGLPVITQVRYNSAIHIVISSQEKIQTLVKNNE